MTTTKNNSLYGNLSGLGAYLLWGMLPIYWKQLGGASAPEILMHRIIWGFLFLVFIGFLTGGFAWLKTLKRQHLLRLSIQTLMLASNWLLYIWSVNNGYIVETSIGYFMNPLIYVVLGVVLLSEKINRLEIAAVLIACAGVIWITVMHGAFPWRAVLIATTFGFYGLFKKLSPMDSISGLTAETALLLPFALGWVLYLHISGNAAFCTGDMKINLFLLGAGAATTTPLILFSWAAKRITLIRLGFLQYIAPSLQFLAGVFIYGETVGFNRGLGIGMILLATIIYIFSQIHQNLRHNSLK
ncbi:EamA family transporter RarD [Myxococcota bacterium]|nr:EamA family transporter RarD [Myxococcota bacterium]MBU1382855.1 EamA family transporter RarD [Myxococcota bacterium]MBU1496773.1 EamA family transporter RarD [Myxococcota bacterium]